MSRVKALILAAGLGTRLKPLTDTTPKCLVPVAGRPLIDYWFEALIHAGVREVLINTHALADEVRQYIRQVNSRLTLRITEFHEPKLLGSAGTIAANPYFADNADEIIIIYADNLSEVDLTGMLQFHRSHDDPMTMLLFHAPRPKSCGIAELDASERVASFEEKPRHPRSDLANAGVYILSSFAYQRIAGLRAFDLGYDILPKFVGHMRGWTVEGYHIDIGTPEAYELAQNAGREILSVRGYDRTGLRPAVFFDRDGTLIEQVHYLADPKLVKLIPDAASTIQTLRQRGFACVVVSNQSALGQGRITDRDLLAVNDEMNRQFSDEGVVLDAVYYCPIAPKGGDRTVVEHPDRKPGPGMLQRAAQQLHIDLARSWMVGDMVSDLLAGRNAGCQGSIFVETGKGMTEAEQAAIGPYEIVPNLTAAAQSIIQQRTRGLQVPH